MALRGYKSHSLVLDSVHPTLKFLRTLMPQHTAVVKMRQNKSVIKLFLSVNWQNIPQPSYFRESPKTPPHISNGGSPMSNSHLSTPPNTSLYHTLSKPVPATSLSHYLTLSFYPSLTTTTSESFHIQPQPVFLYPPCHNFNIPRQTLLQVNSCKHIQCAR